MGFAVFPKFTLVQPQSAFRAQKSLKSRALIQLKRELQRVVKPEIQKQVDDLLGEDPGPVKLPFQFSTEKSRRAYFTTRGFGHGIPYRRTDNLRTSWRVDLKSQLSREFIIITNPKSYAKYVYGNPKQRQVPGHKNTGWGKDFDTAIELINEHAVILVTQAWQRAILTSMRVAA